jgi:hypothetical protein
MQTTMQKYRAVSNVDAQGYDVSANRRYNGCHADVRFFESIEKAEAFLAFNGGVIYESATDKLVKAIQPQEAA